MKKSDTCIIIGGSHAASQLVSRLRPEGWTGKIVMISSDFFHPYHRPPLSKAYLSGEKNKEELLIRSVEFYKENDIEVRLNTTVTSIDTNQKTLTLDTNEVLNYDKLAICSGGSVRKLTCQGSELKNIFYLRDLKDSIAIKEQVTSSKKAVVIGGGYIGLETAASFKKIGLEVTVIEAQSRILERTSSEETASYIAKEFDNNEVTIVSGEMVNSFIGKNDCVTEVVCSSGNTYEADIVVVGIGIIPNIHLAKEAGLETGDGILVNKYAVTSNSDIVAAGDCTYHPNPSLGISLRLESVPNANDQANSAAASICNIQKEYDSVPWFWSDQFEMKLKITGLSNDYDNVVTHETSKGFSAWYFKDNKFIAVDTINDPISFMVGKQLLTKKHTVSTEQFKNSLPNVRSLLKM